MCGLIKVGAAAHCDAPQTWNSPEEIWRKRPGAGWDCCPQQVTVSSARIPQVNRCPLLTCRPPPQGKHTTTPSSVAAGSGSSRQQQEQEQQQQHK